MACRAHTGVPPQKFVHSRPPKHKGPGAQMGSAPPVPGGLLGQPPPPRRRGVGLGRTVGPGGGDDRAVGRLAAGGALRVGGLADRVAGTDDVVGRLLVTSGLRPVGAALCGGLTPLVRGATDLEGTVTRVDDPFPVEGLTVVGLEVIGRAELARPAWFGTELWFPPTLTAVPRRLRSDGRETAARPAAAGGVVVRRVSGVVVRGVPLRGSNWVGRAAGVRWPGSSLGRRDVDDVGACLEAALARRGAMAGTTCSAVPLRRRDAVGAATQPSERLGSPRRSSASAIA